MSDNYLKTVEDFCKSHGFSPPKITGKVVDDGQYLVTVAVTTGADITLDASRMANREVEARVEALKGWIGEYINKSTDQSVQRTENEAQNSQVDSSVVSSTGIHSSELIKDEVSEIANSVGHLNEVCQKKGFAFPTYDVLSSCGEPHRPFFTMLCSLEAKGELITGTGKGCPKQEAKKRAAQVVIRILREREVNAARGLANSSAGASKPDISSYFKNKFQVSAQMAQNIIENGSDYLQKLDRMADLIDCRLNYILSAGDCNQVVLQLLVKGSDYPLMTTVGASNRGVDVSRGIAAKKAVLMFKILYTIDDN